ncbi:unnamed protein product [Effrenium voratum]|uniref:Uncharacterized protein n=1 Tax=Effrenium voratum TaxID=2562239 RepID=A0AA36IFJ0_9DINO|nr:unnamed protein product [Effrenium voratum]CAJ1459823.1 unnamed protein product [Effrenium voratum]
MIRSQRIKQRMDAEGDAKRVSKLCTVGGAMPAATTAMSEYYRHDGVRITHDPYAPGMAEKYGLPGKTDNEGFDPYADTVGPGIYGGIVKRDTSGQVLIGRQYQNHNPRPGPIYAGGGYTPINEALRKGTAALKPLLDKYPDLANDISTGGATPLHMCGMGRDNQHATEYLIKRGAKVEALDTYGMTPLHRMASNNLPVGARTLLEAKADPSNRGQARATPMEIAQDSRAREVMAVIAEYSSKPRPSLAQLRVSNSGVESVNAMYTERDPKVIPVGFSLTCSEQRWDSEKMQRMVPTFTGTRVMVSGGSTHPMAKECTSPRLRTPLCPATAGGLWA